MITLSTFPQITTVLGGIASVGYGHVVLSPITMQPFGTRITATIRMTSTADPQMDVVTGTLDINVGTGVLLFIVPQLNIQRRMQLSAGQIGAVQTIITDAQNALESGLLAVGVIAGTQSTGA